jgi:glutamate racemase
MKNMDNRPIGIFDSGVGGLTIASEVMKALPGEKIIYFGDTARVPYGSKSKDTVTRYSRQMVNFLIGKGVKAIVAACNTVCANSLDKLTEEFDIPIIDVLNPGALSCLEATRNNIVGVIGTEGTINSGAYEKALKSACPDVTVYSKACPLFVPLAEEGWTSNSVANITTEIYLQELIDKEIDSLLLGCTHYPLLIDCIKRVTGGINIINSAVAVAGSLKAFLEENKMLSDNKISTEHIFYVSDDTVKFKRTSKAVFGKDFDALLVDIDS